MSTPDQPPEDVYGESAEVHERNIRIGVHIIAGTTLMFFFPFAFTYLYLRSLDSHGEWNADGVAAPDGYGAVITVLIVLSAVAMSVAGATARGRRPWVGAAALALVAGLAAVVVQAFEYANLGFGPTDGGYASVFYGWTIFLAVFVLGAMYWVWILLAEGLRIDGMRSTRALPGFDEATFYLRVIALIALIAWFLLYIR